MTRIRPRRIASRAARATSGWSRILCPVPTASNSRPTATRPLSRGWCRSSGACIPVNIYELGLIYDVKVEDTGLVSVIMTLTAPGCPAAGSLPLEVEDAIRGIGGVSDVKLDVVWDPPWTIDRMTDEAKLELGLL